MNKGEMIFGVRPVMEAILAGREIEKIWVQQGTAGETIKELKALASKHGIPAATVPAQKITGLAGKKTHQGVVCFLSPVVYASLDHLVDRAYGTGRDPAFVMLDRITDVRNFGAIARTAECLGLDGLIIEERGNAPLTGDAMKTSAGALNHLPVCREKNLLQTISYLKESGLVIVACTEKADALIWQARLNRPIVLLIGNEENGISASLLRKADELVKIPLAGKIQSLNASVAAGMAMYELAKQRKMT